MHVCVVIYQHCFMAQKLTVKRNDVLVRLPHYTDTITRTQQSGIELHTLGLQTYDPVSGTVIHIGPDCKDVKLFDEVFFQVFTYSTGLERAYGDYRNKEFKNEYRPIRHIAFQRNEQFEVSRLPTVQTIKKIERLGFECEQPDDYPSVITSLKEHPWFLIIPEGELYCLRRGDKYIMLNDYVIALPVAKEDSTGNIQIADTSGKSYRPNCCKPLHVPQNSWLADVQTEAYTLRFCDITIEERFNHPQLPADAFIVEQKNIIAMKANATYTAAPKRIIILPDVVETETSSGLINLERTQLKLLTGKVISSGDGCPWLNGETVFYAKNSGMPIPDTDYLVLADIDVFGSVTECHETN